MDKRWTLSDHSMELERVCISVFVTEKVTEPQNVSALVLVHRVLRHVVHRVRIRLKLPLVGVIASGAIVVA